MKRDIQIFGVLFILHFAAAAGYFIGANVLADKFHPMVFVVGFTVFFAGLAIGLIIYRKQSFWFLVAIAPFTLLMMPVLIYGVFSVQGCPIAGPCPYHEPTIYTMLLVWMTFSILALRAAFKLRRSKKLGIALPEYNAKFYWLTRGTLLILATINIAYFEYSYYYSNEPPYHISDFFYDAPKRPSLKPDLLKFIGRFL